MLSLADAVDGGRDRIAREHPEWVEAASGVREWLHALLAHQVNWEDFDAEISGRHIYQFTRVCGVADPDYPILMEQVERRLAARGLVRSRWRGWYDPRQDNEAEMRRAADAAWAALVTKYGQELARR